MDHQETLEAEKRAREVKAASAPRTDRAGSAESGATSYASSSSRGWSLSLLKINQQPENQMAPVRLMPEWQYLRHHSFDDCADEGYFCITSCCEVSRAYQTQDQENPMRWAATQRTWTLPLRAFPFADRQVCCTWDRRRISDPFLLFGGLKASCGPGN